jgi:hypothetical protein
MATYVKTHKPSSTKHKPGETTEFELTPRKMGQPNMMQAHQDNMHTKCCSLEHIYLKENTCSQEDKVDMEGI